MHCLARHHTHALPFPFGGMQCSPTSLWDQEAARQAGDSRISKFVCRALWPTCCFRDTEEVPPDSLGYVRIRTGYRNAPGWL